MRRVYYSTENFLWKELELVMRKNPKKVRKKELDEITAEEVLRKENRKKRRLQRKLQSEVIRINKDSAYKLTETKRQHRKLIKSMPRKCIKINKKIVSDLTFLKREHQKYLSKVIELHRRILIQQVKSFFEFFYEIHEGYFFIHEGDLYVKTKFVYDGNKVNAIRIKDKKFYFFDDGAITEKNFEVKETDGTNYRWDLNKYDIFRPVDDDRYYLCISEYDKENTKILRLNDGKILRYGFRNSVVFIIKEG